MCNYFSCIATQDGRLLFTEEDHHETIIHRAGLKDVSLIRRNFVRLEILPPFDTVKVDEQGTLPAWFEEYRNSVEEKAIALALRVDAVDAKWRPEYDAVNAKWRPERDAVDAKWSAERDAVDAKRSAERAEIPGYLPAIN